MAKKNRHIFIVGPTGCGKTTLIQSGFHSGMFPMRLHILDPKDEHAGRLITPQEMAREGNPATFRTRSVPDTEEEIEQALAICHARGNCWVLCEEVGDYPRSQELRTILRRGRSAGVFTICTTQRPAECHRTVSASAACVVLYRMVEPRDREYIRQRYGREIEEEMLALESYEHLVLGDEDLYIHYYRSSKPVTAKKKGVSDDKNPQLQ